jgi:hypothetical protein
MKLRTYSVPNDRRDARKYEVFTQRRSLPKLNPFDSKKKKL